MEYIFFAERKQWFIAWYFPKGNAEAYKPLPEIDVSIVAILY